MKNKILYTALAYWFLILGLVLILSGCRTKKSKTDLKQTETENVSIVDNSKVDKKETIDENIISSKTSESSDKSFFEAWMSFESDKITITDKSGTVTEIINPRYNKKQSQSNNISKTEQSTEESNKVATNEENQQIDIDVRLSKEVETDLQETTKVKGREPVWLWVVGGCVFGGLAYLVLRRFKLI